MPAAPERLLDPSSLKLPAALPVRQIDAEPFVDTLGDPALRVTVVVDTDLEGGLWTWKNLKPIQDAIFRALEEGRRLPVPIRPVPYGIGLRVRGQPVSLHDDLRNQAWHLARREPRRPTQASLRRAISAAYYSLFHLLIDESTASVFGRSGARRPFRQALARGYGHGSMSAACKSFSSGSLPAVLAPALGSRPLPAELRQVANAFVKLQLERHRADYDLTAVFRRSEVVAVIQELEEAVRAWRAVRTNDVARFFLITLPLWDQLRRAS